MRERSDGLWEAREPPEAVPFGEKPRSFYGKSRAVALRKLCEAMRDREQGFSTDSDRLTIGEYLERWVEGPLRESVAEKTYDDYSWICRKHLIPALGRMKLKKLTAEHLDGRIYSRHHPGRAPESRQEAADPLQRRPRRGSPTQIRS